MTSGKRFSVVYQLTGDEKEAYAKAQDICVEQTIEYPYELLAPGFIKDEVVGRIESFAPLYNNQGYQAIISYAVELTANELTQLLNVVFGNISIKPGILVDKLILPDSLLNHFKGPRFGREGLRQLLGVNDRPLLFTAIKPMGLTSLELAKIVYQCALGGIDMIKDDHGLTNQSFAPFEERVALCSEAVHKANAETGRKSIYVANITGPANEILARAKFAKQAGAGGLLASPGLIGLDTMRWLAGEDELALPIINHPAFQGSYVTSASYGFGFSHYALYGQISRLAGADAVIYPNFGGRFSFSIDECRNIVRGTQEPMGHLKAIFPSPGGGMTIERIPELLGVYGKDVALLMGGGLFTQGLDLVQNCQCFLEVVEKR